MLARDWPFKLTGYKFDMGNTLCTLYMYMYMSSTCQPLLLSFAKMMLCHQSAANLNVKYNDYHDVCLASAFFNIAFVSEKKNNNNKLQNFIVGENTRTALSLGPSQLPFILDCLIIFFALDHANCNLCQPCKWNFFYCQFSYSGHCIALNQPFICSSTTVSHIIKISFEF